MPAWGPCPRDTDGDGDCGNRYCEHCGDLVVWRLTRKRFERRSETEPAKQNTTHATDRSRVRERKGLTQMGVAEAIGVSRSMYIRYEYNGGKLPPDALAKLIELLRNQCQ